jgi:lipoate-protein ligase A
LNLQYELIVDPPLNGRENMRRDRERLYHAEYSSQKTTFIRLYSWERSTVSLGQNQVPREAVNLEYCSKRGIPLVHRPTGGRAVLHADELTYSVISNDLDFFGNSISDVYLRIGMALKKGLEEAGIDCELAKGTNDSAGRIRDGFRFPCFVSASRAELKVQGRKISGSAQRRLKRSFLQHGSMPLNVDYTEMAEVLEYDPVLLRKSMISLSEAAGRNVTFAELAKSLVAGFRALFGNGQE